MSSRDDDSQIVRTTTKRLAKGIAIVVGIMIVGGVIALSQWEHMHSVPPQSSKLKPKFDLSKTTAAHHTEVAAEKATGGGAAKPKADVTLTILEGAASQGSPDFDPDKLTIKKGNTIRVDNTDSMPHTVTNGKGASDATSGKLFDTSIINGGDSKVIETTNVDAGEHPFYCTVHPYMTGTLIVQ
jgi:plastocyanin